MRPPSSSWWHLPAGNHDSESIPECSRSLGHACMHHERPVDLWCGAIRTFAQALDVLFHQEACRASQDVALRTIKLLVSMSHTEFAQHCARALPTLVIWWLSGGPHPSEELTCQIPSIIMYQHEPPSSSAHSKMHTWLRYDLCASHAGCTCDQPTGAIAVHKRSHICYKILMLVT
jgi:hypothetical protein